MELDGLSDSFSALARLYARHYRKENDEAPKLYVTRLETGSVVMEIAPLAIVMGGFVLADNAVIAADFANRLWRGIKAFSGADAPRIEKPSIDDAADIREFARPLTGKTGAQLGISHARYEKTDGTRKTIVEYKFDETEINRAALNIDAALALPPLESVVEQMDKRHSIQKEVMLFIEQANRGPGKEKGRTGDRGVIPDIDDKPHPVYFRKSFNDLKEKMALGEINPLTSAFIVDVHVQYVDDEIRGYIITEVHQVIPNSDQ